MRSRTVTVIVLGLALLAVAPRVVDAAAKKDAWYAQHYFLMQDYERKAYKALTPNGKLEFQKVYWEFRSPAIREEFDRRLAYIEPTFKNENSAQPWNTDRGRIYLLHGRPAGIDQRQNDFWTGQYTPPGAQAGISSDRSGEDIQGKTLEIWAYPFEREVVYYGFQFQPPSKWIQVQISPSAGRYIQGLERRSRVETWGPSDEDAYKARLEELKAIK